MKNLRLKNVLLIFATVSLLFFTNSCSDDDDNIEPTQLTNKAILELTVKNNIGNSVSGAIVNLYKTQKDWDNNTNKVTDSKATDSNGLVTYNDLEPIKYFWKISSGCRNNINGSNSTVSSLQINTINKTTAIISETGTLRFINNSNNPYRIFINGTAFYDLDGKYQIDTKNRATGNYTIRVLQLSGYAFNPTDKTYTGTLTCGQTLTAEFPN